MSDETITLGAAEMNASRLEALASWSRRVRIAGTLRVQVFAGDAWRNVIPIESDQEAAIMATLTQIAELLPAVRWRIARPNKTGHTLVGDEA